jgi:hypothetical protein
MPSVGFETTISAGERPQTHALDREATGTGKITSFKTLNFLAITPSLSSSSSSESVKICVDS